MLLVLAWIRRVRSSASGVNASIPIGCVASKIGHAVADRRIFPPTVVVEIKALACELPSRCGLPLARWSLAELRREAVAQGLVAQISGTTLWRWLSQDALRPWRHRCWIFPRDPAFAVKAGRILDLYQRRWENKPLGLRDYVLCADEKTSIQARRRKHPSLPPASGRPIYVEHEYARTGAWAYIAAWDVHRAKLFGRCERKTGIVPFDRLVAQVMRQEPYRSARRVFWIVDNGSSHRGQRAAARLRAKWRKQFPAFRSFASRVTQNRGARRGKFVELNSFPGRVRALTSALCGESFLRAAGQRACIRLPRRSRSICFPSTTSP
jgi:hypothetical protein